MGQPFLTRLYCPTPLATGATLPLDEKARHFLLHVLRAKAGDTLLLFNAEDGEFAATLSIPGKKDLVAHIGAQTRAPALEPDLWLCFAPVKKAPVDFIAQKAAELGVSCLIPTLTARTVVTRVNTERLLANAIEGAEQTGRLSAPTAREPVRLMDLLSQWPADRRLLLADESHTSPPLLEALRTAGGRGQPWAALIGPEGGFTADELRIVKALPQTVSASLGPRLLRADTAALAALAGWQMVLGDWVGSTEH
jgi:16S rRNA (uracil1498-N3)-methyltransferase